MALVRGAKRDVSWSRAVFLGYYLGTPEKSFTSSFATSTTATMTNSFFLTTTTQATISATATTTKRPFLVLKDYALLPLDHDRNKKDT